MRVAAAFLFPIAVFLAACGGEPTATDRPWTADAHTHAAIARMQGVFDRAAVDPAKAELPACRALAEGLQTEVNALVAGCTMSGPDHDRLHRWLGDLLASIRTLRDSQDAAALGQAVKEAGATLAQFRVLFQPTKAH